MSNQRSRAKGDWYGRHVSNLTTEVQQYCTERHYKRRNDKCWEVCTLAIEVALAVHHVVRRALSVLINHTSTQVCRSIRLSSFPPLATPTQVSIVIFTSVSCPAPLASPTVCCSRHCSSPGTRSTQTLCSYNKPNNATILNWMTAQQTQEYHNSLKKYNINYKIIRSVLFLLFHEVDAHFS